MSAAIVPSPTQARGPAAAASHVGPTTAAAATHVGDTRADTCAESMRDRAIVVAARGLAVGRGAAAILREIELVIARGERIALVGGNGSGKTTLLRALGGIDAPRAGTITWNGSPLPRGPARVATVGVLFQGEPASALDVRTMITLGLALDGPPGDDARKRVDDAIAAAELAPFVNRPCATLSGGEAQRVLLARALVARPGLLLLDEPSNHLDPARQAALFSALDRLRTDGSCAVVLATHDLGLAATCDRVALLAHGRIDAIGTPRDVLTPARLADALGVAVRRIDDPDGGPPFLRVTGAAPRIGAPSRTGAASSFDSPSPFDSLRSLRVGLAQDERA